MFEKLGNLENCLSNVERLNRLLNIVEYTYFNRKEIKTPIYFLEQNYKDIQALIQTTANDIKNIQTELKSNVYGLYEEYRKLGVKEYEKDKKVC